MNASSSADLYPTLERHPITTQSCSPLPGQLWVLAGIPGHRHGVFLGGDTWKVLVHSAAGEYSLAPVSGADPVSLSTHQPHGPHWADKFDALARTEGLPITWADEILSYQQGALDLLAR